MLIEWSDENQIYVDSLPERGDLIHTHGATYGEVPQWGKELIHRLAASRRERGEALP